MIDVLIVDDSAFMRKALSLMLEKDDGIRVADTARDGREAVSKVEDLRPDVLTMDVEMPRMNGLEALRIIMDEHPLPVIMVSSLTEEGAEVTLEAMEAGAADFIPKKLSYASLDIVDIEEELHRKVRGVADGALARSRHRGTDSGRRTTARQADLDRRLEKAPEVVAIGVSTGGPRSLQEVIPPLSADFSVPIVLAQHMPPEFTASMARRLNEASALEVAEVESGEYLEAGRVHVAPGGTHIRIEGTERRPVLRVVDDELDRPYRPSVDELFETAAETLGGGVIGAVLTGMGQDGLEGARAVREAGGVVIAQDEASSVVYGMPKAVSEAGCADMVLPLGSFADQFTRLSGLTRRRSPSG